MDYETCIKRRRIESVNTFLNEENCGVDRLQIGVDRLQIGAGAYGFSIVSYRRDVAIVVYRKAVAIVVSRRNVAVVGYEIDAEAIKVEMHKTHHCSLLQYYNRVLVKDNLCIYVDYMEVGSLADVLLVVRLEVVHIITVSKELLKGLDYLNDKRIVHRDVRARNILLGFDGRVKIGNFRSALQLLPPSYLSTEARTESAGWMAPEVEWEYPYGTKADVWSLGVTLIEMFDGYLFEIVLHRIQSYITDPSESVEVLKSYKMNPLSRQLLDDCLQADPFRRSTAYSLLQLPVMDLALDPRSLNPLLDEANYRMRNSIFLFCFHCMENSRVV